MLRISGGLWCGRKLRPMAGGSTARPTTARVRESVLARLESPLAEARVLDLFAGSGLMGLEMLSRGAHFALVVEKDPKQAQQIVQQYLHLGVPKAQFRVVSADILSWVKRPPVWLHKPDFLPFDMAYLDPPYGFERLPVVLEMLETQGWLTPQAYLVVEQSTRDPILPGYEPYLYGDTRVSIRHLEHP